MTDRPSPLAALILSDPAVADSMSETKRALMNAYERIEDLQTAVKGLLWLCNMLANRADISEDVRDDLTTSQHIIDAQELLR